MLIYRLYKKTGKLNFLTKTDGIDKFFGTLAYPIFLSHILFIKILDHFIKRSSFFTLVAIFVTTISSYFLLKFIDEPINKWRQERLKKV